MTLEEYRKILKDYRSVTGGEFSFIRQEIIRLHNEYFLEHNKPPTYQGLGEQLGVTKQCISYHIQGLVKNDYIELKPKGTIVDKVASERIKKPIKKIIG